LHVSWWLHFVSEKNNPSDSALDFQIIGASPIVDHCVPTLYPRQLLLPRVSVVFFRCVLSICLNLFRVQIGRVS
jgi:hypothetical protein